MINKLQSRKNYIETQYKINARKVQSGENPNALEFIGMVC